MAATITRDLSITYGTLTIGGSTEFYILGDWTRTVDYPSASVSCRVVVQADTEAAMQTACATFEAGVRQIDVDLSLSYGGATAHVDYSQSSNTGMNSRATATVVGGVQQTKLVRVYDVTFEVILPADESGAGGLRTYTVSRRLGANGLSLYRMVGEFTASSSNSAVTNYEDGTTGGSNLLKTITDALSGTYEEVVNDYEYDRRNKVLTFEVVRAQVGYRQAVGTTDNASIKNQTLNVSRRKVAPGDVSDARRLVELDVQFSCEVDASSTTAIEALYDSTIRPNIIETVRTIAGTAVALVDEAPRFAKSQNAVSASMQFVALGESSILSHTITTVDDDEHGIRLVPVHDGNRHAKLRFDGPAFRFRIVTEDVTRFGGSTTASASGSSGSGFAGQNTFGIGVKFPGGAGSFGGGAGSFGGSIFGNAGIVGESFQPGINVQRPGQQSPAASGAGVSTAGYVELRKILRSQPLRLGVPDAGFDIVVQSTTTILEYAEPVTTQIADNGDGGAGQGQNLGAQPLTIPRG